ncbi:TIGR04283 family arsenosugar biosynthesis glycosyltransferase [Kaarinaea lacus]
MPDPKISIIVPTLNEEQAISRLIENLHQQTNIQFELIIVDGGSKDATRSVLSAYQKKSGFNCVIITTQPGRALQMNCGARVATSKELLFLHADTHFNNPTLLYNALTFLLSRRETFGQDRVAGHFSLRFQRQETTPSMAYYFYESKTWLNRLDTINGDQGLMISRAFFDELGGFNESLGYMEDARLARTIFSKGQWITLPGTLTTSARRFEREGLKQRQVLNALMCNFDAIGLEEFFTAAADVYRTQDQTGALQLKPYFLLIHNIATQLGFSRVVRLWYKTGAYVAGNAWQLAFALDCRRNFSQQLPAGEGPTPLLTFYDRWLRRIIDSPPGHMIATVLTFIWFYSSLLLLVLRK